jgi:ribosomal-protein-serine acetyltransferase
MSTAKTVGAPVIKVNETYELRVPLEQDAFQLARVVDENRNYLREWLPWLDSSKGVDDSLSFIQKIHSDWMLNRLLCTLIYKKNEIVGAMGFHVRVHRYTALGYWIARSESGKDLCTDASRAIIKWAFKNYEDLNLVELRAATNNLASRRVAEKLGFKNEGTLRCREWLYTQFVDHVVYSVTRDEWKKLQT